MTATARTRYRAYLEDEKTKKTKEQRGQKRKLAEEEIETMKKRMKTLHDVYQSLEEDADKFAEQAESKAGSRMTELITKSNTMRRRLKEKSSEFKDLEVEVEKKCLELKQLP